MHTTQQTHIYQGKVVYTRQKLCNTVYGKIFAVEHKIHYSLENFCSVSGRGHHALYTQQVIQEENFCDLLKNCENRERFPTQNFCSIW